MQNDVPGQITFVTDNSALLKEFLGGGGAKQKKKAEFEPKILAFEVWRTRESKERFAFIKL